MHQSESSRSAPQRSNRILSVDFWRGVALLTIFINHVPGNIFAGWTHHNFGFSDAAEAFVLLAGIAAGLAYLPAFIRRDGLTGTIRVLRRAVQLYVAHIALVICCAAVIARSVAVTGDLRFFEAINFDVLVHDTVPALIGLVTLQLQPGYLNILPLYMVVLLMAPAFLLLARSSLGLAVAASGALYLAAQVFDLHLGSYPVAGPWFLNPFCWQFLFVLGIAVGALIRSGRKPPRSAVLFWGSCGFLALSAAVDVYGLWPDWQPQWLPRFVWDITYKTNLVLPRLLHVLALAYVLAYLPVERWLCSSVAAWPVILTGRHALPVFCLGTVLAIAAQVVRAEAGGGTGLDILLISGGILAQFVLAGVLEWNRMGQPAQAVVHQEPLRQHS